MSARKLEIMEESKAAHHPLLSWFLKPKSRATEASFHVYLSIRTLTTLHRSLLELNPCSLIVLFGTLLLRMETNEEGEGRGGGWRKSSLREFQLGRRLDN